MTVDIGKAKVSSLITVGQFAMIDAQQMKDGGSGHARASYPSSNDAYLA